MLKNIFFGDWEFIWKKNSSEAWDHKCWVTRANKKITNLIKTKKKFLVVCCISDIFSELKLTNKVFRKKHSFGNNYSIKLSNKKSMMMKLPSLSWRLFRSSLVQNSKIVELFKTLIFKLKFVKRVFTARYFFCEFEFKI